MPTARSGFGVAVVNGQIYAIGGYDKSQKNFLDVNEKYNPATDTWEQKAPMPTKRVSFGIAVYENKVYCFGGQIINQAGNRQVINVTEVYDPATDTWTTKTPMPHLGEDFAANAMVNGRIYAISTFNDVYDPETDKWTTKAAIPEAVAHSANAVIDKKIYVISGTHYGNEPQNYAPINLTQIYDPATDSWSPGAPIPVSIASPAAAVTNGNLDPKAIYVVGGLTLIPDEFGGFIYFPQTLAQIYFPENNSWASGASMPTARYALAAIGVDGKLYAMGGSDSRTTPDLTSNELYLPFGYGTMTNPILPQGIIIGIAVAVVAVIVITGAVLMLRRRSKARS